MNMKKIFGFCFFAFAFSSLSAQTIYEAGNIMDNDINGTARYVGMGGALNALGGDISVISSNPAGIGIYRSNDVVVSMGPHITSTSMNGNVTKQSMFSFDNIGFVYSINMGRKSPVRFVNFAFNYNKRKNYNNSYKGRWNDGFSQTNLFADLAVQGNSELGGMFIEKDFYLDSSINPYTTSPYIGWLPIMAYNSYLINPVYDKDGKLSHWKGYDVNDGNSHTYDYGHFYDVTESGWINDYDFNLSFNILDNVYLGATLTATDVKYSKNSLYKEDFYEGRISYGGYDLNNFFSTSGAGIGFSVGAIFRLHQNFRMGLSFTTPTLYMLTDYQESNIAFDIDLMDPKDGKIKSNFGSINPVDDSGYAMAYQYNYRIVTPWKVNMSAGAVLFNRLALDVEYEYMDASKAKIKYSDGLSIDVLNDGYDFVDSKMGGIKQSFNHQHTAKVGAEFRILPSLALRGGFGYVSEMMDKSSFKLVESTSARTETDYCNIMDKYYASCGLGYAGKRFYVDVAYQFIKTKADFYAFDALYMNSIPLKMKKHNLLFSVGARF